MLDIRAYWWGGLHVSLTRHIEIQHVSIADVKEIKDKIIKYFTPPTNGQKWYELTNINEETGAVITWLQNTIMFYTNTEISGFNPQKTFKSTYEEWNAKNHIFNKIDVPMCFANVFLHLFKTIKLKLEETNSEVDVIKFDVTTLLDNVVEEISFDGYMSHGRIANVLKSLLRLESLPTSLKRISILFVSFDNRGRLPDDTTCELIVAIYQLKLKHGKKLTIIFRMYDADKANKFFNLFHYVMLTTNQAPRNLGIVMENREFHMYEVVKDLLSNREYVAMIEKERNEYLKRRYPNEEEEL
jgi:hypothetical protein